MKLMLPVIVWLTISMLLACSKWGEPQKRINCSGLVTVTPDSNNSGGIYHPNALSHDREGLNDTIRPFAKNIDSIQINLYHKNNTVLFATNIWGDDRDPPAAPLPVKKYYYKIQTVTKIREKISLYRDLYARTCFFYNKIIQYAVQVI